MLQDNQTTHGGATTAGYEFATPIVSSEVPSQNERNACSTAAASVYGITATVISTEPPLLPPTL